MKQFTKRILAVLLTVAMVLALIPMALVSAATPTELSIPVINVEQSSERQTATALLLSTENLLVGAYEAKTTPRADAGKGYIKIDRNACFFSKDKPTVSSAIAQSYVAASGTNLSYDSEFERYVLFSYGVIIEPNTPAGTYFIDISLEVLVSPEGIEYPYTPNTQVIQVNVVDTVTAELSIPAINVQRSSERQTANTFLLSTENMLVGAYEAKTTPRADAGKGYIKIDRNACFFSKDKPTVSSAIAQSYVAASGTNLSYDNEFEKYVLFSYGVIIEPNTPVGTYYIDVALEVLVSPEGTDYPYTFNTRVIQVNVVDASCDHSVSRINATEATCTEAGNTVYYTCTLCGKYFSDATATKEIEKDSWIISALGHNVIIDAAVEPTCTATGKTEGSHCDRCGEVIVAQEEIPALGHNIVVYEAVDPTCTTPGKTEGGYCDRCDYVIIQEEIPALGHNMVVYEAVEPTCTTPGKTRGGYCSVCDYIIVQEEIPALGHDMITDPAVEATCTTAGKTEGAHCSRCDHMIAQEEIPALGHDMVIDAAVAPTCTTIGKTEGCHCSRCDYVEIQELIPALGHDMIIDAAEEPTCTTAGKTEGAHCSRCDRVIAQKEIPALGHDLITDPAVEATCTTAGKTEGSHCSRCDYVVAQEEIPELGHDWDEGVVTIEPTTTTEGEKTYTCSRCDATRTEVIPVLEETIPVDTDNDEIADTDVEAEPDEGLTYVDEDGNVYIPIDSNVEDGNLDGEADFYVEVTENAEGDYPYTDSFGNDYIPVDVDADDEADVFVKVTDEDNDGKPEDEAGNEYEGVDSDGDGDPDYWKPLTPSTIPVDTDNDEIVDADVEAEPGEGLTYVDGDGNLYIPVDSNKADGNIDGEMDFYVEVTENEEGDYPYTDNFDNEYIPVDFNSDGEPDVFVKVTDDDNDGKPEDEVGNGYEGVDSDGDGDTDYWKPETNGEHVYTPEVIQFNGYVYGTFYSCSHCNDCYYEKAAECDRGAGCSSASFVDLDLTKWYHPYTDFAIITGMMRGTGDQTFEPNTTTSRAMVVMVLWNLENQPTSNTVMPFSDVQQGDWYYSAILWAYENDIARGMGDGTFNPEGNVTRQELAAFIHRYAEWKGCDVSARADLSAFPDAAETSDWAVEDLKWAVAVGFINGRGTDGLPTLSPLEDGERCEFAAMMMRFVSNVLMKPTWDRINSALVSAGKEPVEKIK